MTLRIIELSEVDNEISKLLHEFANTELSKRRNGWVGFPPPYCLMLLRARLLTLAARTIDEGKLVEIMQSHINPKMPSIALTTGYKEAAQAIMKYLEQK